MTKTKEELIKLKNEFEAFNAKLVDLTEDELILVTGGISLMPNGTPNYNWDFNMQQYGNDAIDTSLGNKVKN